MKNRALNPSYRNYTMYGGRGIGICQEWADSFQAFLADMGEAPDGCTLDRIDVDGDYGPENCRWADNFMQSQNRRNVLLIDVGGVICHGTGSASRATGVSRAKIHSLIKMGGGEFNGFQFTPATSS